MIFLFSSIFINFPVRKELAELHLIATIQLLSQNNDKGMNYSKNMVMVIGGGIIKK
jgi:hypothetical protein